MRKVITHITIFLSLISAILLQQNSYAMKQKKQKQKISTISIEPIELNDYSDDYFQALDQLVRLAEIDTQEIEPETITEIAITAALIQYKDLAFSQFLSIKLFNWINAEKTGEHTSLFTQKERDFIFSINKSKKSGQKKYPTPSDQDLQNPLIAYLWKITKWIYTA